MQPKHVSSVHKSTHITALDGLRGLAALVIVFYHLFVAGWSNSPVLHLIQRFTTSGWVGVDLFFVLSGYLITGILLDTLDAPSYFKTFYARRALRIFPLYYLSLILAVVFRQALNLHWSGLFWVYLLDIQNNLGFLLVRPFFFLHPPNLSAIDHLWTLALEEQFYLVWPLVVYLCRDRRRLLIYSLAACAAALILRIVLWTCAVNQTILINSTPCRFDALLYGSCLALACDGGISTRLRERLIPFARPLCCATLAAIFLIATLRHNWSNEDPAVYTIGFTLMDIFFAALILLATRPGSATSRIFSIAPLRTLGTYSYGLYVYHKLIAELFKAPLRNMIDLHHSKLSGVLASTLLLSLLSLAIAVVSYHLFEQPFLRLKRHFPYKPSKQR